MTLPTKEIVLAPGEGNHLVIGDSEVTFKAIGADTHGHLGLFENLIQPGGTAPQLHIHRQMEELFYVLEGEREKYFQGLAELFKDGQTPSREALVELMARFDQELVKNE
jgi:mannose-6-phosphate isomerase-like protein (cupin superfamily)